MARWLLSALMFLAACREPAAPTPPPIQPADPAPVLRARIDACEDPLLAAADLPTTIDRAHSPALSRGCFAVVVRIDAPSYLRFRSLRIAFDGVAFHELGFEHDPDAWTHTLVVGPAPAGSHRLTITAEVGPKFLGTFAYSAFQLRLTRAVDIELGKGDPPIVYVSFDEVGGVTTPVEERLRLRARVSARSELTTRRVDPLPPIADTITAAEAVTLHAYVIRALRRARLVRDAVWVWCLYPKDNEIAELRRRLAQNDSNERVLARIRVLAIEAAQCTSE